MHETVAVAACAGLGASVLILVTVILLTIAFDKALILAKVSHAFIKWMWTKDGNDLLQNHWTERLKPRWLEHAREHRENKETK